VDVDGHRERSQFKHKDNDDRPLTLATFTTDARDLALDRLVAAAVADREGPGINATRHAFRVVLRDSHPTDEKLVAVLRPANPDPGPFLRGMPTRRLQFNPEALLRGVGETGGERSSFGFLSEGERAVRPEDLKWVCERLIVEVQAPAASGDLTAAGPAEQLLLSRARADIGAELFPNAGRSAIDVAEAMIRTARAARQGRMVVTVEELLRRTRVRQDFGAVARAHPVDRAVEIPRARTVERLLLEVDRALSDRKAVLVVGPPGQGKSWLCQEFIDELADRGWLVAEHYCYLGDADGERLERVLAESVFGSLLGRLAEGDPGAVVDQRPRFAADEEALEAAVRRARSRKPDRPIALLVDGIDHVTRVRAGPPNSDPSFALAEALSFLDLPAGSVMIVLSQPGAHLRPFEQAGAARIDVPGLDERELRALGGRLAVVPDEASADAAPLISDADEVEDFLEALGERSAGNALYATYLCREASRDAATIADPAAVVRNLPAFDGTLANYYQHLYAALGSQGDWVADVIALIDFGVSRAELKEIRPDMAHRVDRALAVLEPVLLARAAQGGIRLYHDSFGRFLRQPFQRDRSALVALLGRIATWLKSKGMFIDPRTFRSLLPVLAEADQDQEAVELVDRDFVVRSIAAGFPASAITINLATALRCAARSGNWPAVVRYVELARAAETYQDERFDSTLVEFADIPMALLGADTFANRLLADGRPVMSARAGLQMCAAVDALGGVAPWGEYMRAFPQESENDNTSYGEGSDRQVAIAWLRGRLRLSALAQGLTGLDGAPDGPALTSELMSADQPATPASESDGESDIQAPIDWDGLAEFVADHKLPPDELVPAIIDTYGFQALVDLAPRLKHRGDFCVEIAQEVSSGRIPGDHGSARTWATRAAAEGTRPGSVHQLLSLGVAVGDLANGPVDEAREELLTLTRRVQLRSVQWESGVVGQWLDACALAARLDRLGLAAAHALITGRGWYPCWLRFATALVVAESSLAQDQSRLSLDALQLLAEDLDPFAGDPRSCDLYSIHEIIETTIRRAIALTDDEGWAKALHLLKEVSNGTTTTLFGELGGPVPPDRLLRLAVETAGPTRWAAAEGLLHEEIENGAARRFYSDLAEYRLLAARLAHAAGDRDEAERRWTESCQMLTAYGWHKDITIYELLDPLPHLIKADASRGRARVARLQALCERVPIHTDLKETRGAWPRWWEMLAQADPAALARLASPTLLRACNDPNDLLHGARHEVWRAWQHKADPIVAGALRLTIDAPLDPIDPDAFTRLAAVADGTGHDAAAKLITLLLARLDERPPDYGYSNSDELLARDAERVEAVNAASEPANVPRVTPVPDGRKPNTTPDAAVGARALDRPERGLQAMLDDAVEPAYAPGAVGLARAIRAWRLRPYGDRESPLATNRAANVFGYRLIEIADAGREDEAAAAIRMIADASGFGERARVLSALAEGLERFGYRELSAIAYALTWTRARGRGGWLTFGGETEIAALRRAAQIDRSVVLAVMAQEAEQILSRGRYGTYGMSQAIIYAFSAAPLSDSATSALDIAFRSWDEACAVIEDRAPRVHPSDDPSEPYLPSDPDGGDETPGNLNQAFAMATLGGLGHPGREAKRRAFIAASLLVTDRPDAAAPAFNIALRHLSDPSTLAWLLRVLERAGTDGDLVVDACADALAALAEGRYLTVRALARRLLGDRAPRISSPSSPDRELLDTRPSALWVPPGITSNDDEPPGLDELIDSVAGNRLAAAERILPGTGNAVRARVLAAVAEDSHKGRLQSQLDAFANRIEKRWPDAYLVSEQAIEEALQCAAAGGRAARLAVGEPVAVPVAWEDGLARAILDDPWFPLAVEATRQPRPDIGPPPTQGDPIWQALKAASEGRSRDALNIQSAIEHGGLLLGTLSLQSHEVVLALAAGPFKGWRTLATIETRTCKSPDRTEQGDRMARRYRVVEVREPGHREALSNPPLASGDIRAWLDPLPDVLFARKGLQTSQPIIGMDRDVDTAGDGHRGLGVPAPMLAPSVPLIATLGLRPGAPFILDDTEGPALALVTWRAEYDTSEYHLPWPRLRGAAVLLRDDLFANLLTGANGNLVLRDFIVGDAELADQPGALDVSEARQADRADGGSSASPPRLGAIEAPSRDRSPATN